MSTYDVHHFIRKFEATKEDEWCTELYQNFDGTRRCALGHCGCSYDDDDETQEGEALVALLGDVPEINDGYSLFYNFPEDSTPRSRILQALYELRDRKQQLHGVPQ